MIFAQILMKFCRNFADNLENVEIFLKFLNFLGKVPILKEFEWFEWFEWFGPSPIEPFNPGLNTIAAVHGWESSAARKGFLGGVEPARLLASIRAEVAALSPAAAALERADLLLELERVRDRVEGFDRRGTEPFEPFEPF